MTFGRLDVVPDILNNIPASGRVRRLANVVIFTLPLPKNWSTHDDSKEIIEWVKKHQDKLVWNEETLKFELRD